MTPRARRTDRAALVAAVSASMLLFACGRPDPPPPVSTSAAATTTTAPANREASADALHAKLNRYVRVHDLLVGGAGLAATRLSYEQAMLDLKRKADPDLNVGVLESVLGDLRQPAAPVADGLTELDAAATRLADALEPLRVRLDALKDYFGSRRYGDDNGALARDSAGDTVAAFDQAASAAAGFDRLLNRALDARDAQRLKNLEASGDRLDYNLALAMKSAQALVRSTRDAAARPPTRARAGQAEPPLDAPEADAALATMEPALAGARSELETRRREEPDADYAAQGSTIGELNDLAGLYRKLRASPTDETARLFVWKYNSAIEHYNRTRQRSVRPVAN